MGYSNLTQVLHTDFGFHVRIRHFAAARELIPLEDCSRSVTALQAVMCMAIYLKSVSAQRVVHTYVSTACYAVYVYRVSSL